MSIINTAHPGSSLSLLCLIDNILIKLKEPPSYDKLLSICRPNGLAKNDNQKGKFAETLDFWITQGLYVKENGSIKLNHLYKKADALSYRVLMCLLSNLSPESDLDGNKAERLFTSLACLLSIDKYTFYGKDYIEGNMIVDTLNNELVIRGNTNYRSPLIEYGVFLGFFEYVDKTGNSSRYICDPTRAIENVLNDVFLDEEELQGVVFINRLSEILPILDVGYYRKKVEKKMNTQHNRINNEISASLSHALYRLNVAYKIGFIDRADNKESLTVRLPDGERSSISWIADRRAL
jgi:hypothetical protein